jgi:hypothetical protein
MRWAGASSAASARRRAKPPALARRATRLGVGGAGVSALLAGLSTLGLGFLVNLGVQMPILYGTLALALAGVGLASWRQRRPAPLLLGLMGAGAVLYPFHEALELWAFHTLIAGGMGLLMLAS